MKKMKQLSSDQKLMTNLLDEFPTIESMMFKNKNAQRNHKRKKQYKQFKLKQSK